MGTLALGSERGLETEGSRALAPPRAEGQDTVVKGEVWTEVAFCGDSLEEGDEDAKKQIQTRRVLHCLLGGRHPALLCAFAE